MSDANETTVTTTGEGHEATAVGATPHVSAGMEVRYHPHDCHALDGDHLRRPVFRLLHMRDAPNTAFTFKKGDELAHPLNDEPGGLGSVRARIGDKLHTKSGHILHIAGPKHAWKAVVREVFSDGTVALDIEHPHGGITLHYPDHGHTTGLAYDPTGRLPHTWHLPADEKKGA